jgi:hypothetical protein
MDFNATVSTIASTQGGVITRAQAIQAGMSPNQIDRRVQTRRWTALINGGYRLFEMPGDLPLVKAAIALLPRAVASHFSAAAIHGLRTVPTREVSVLVHSQTTHTFPGVRVFRCHDLDDEHVEMRVGVPVTTVERTVTDLAALVTPAHLGVILDDAVAARIVTCEQVRTVLDSVARKGKPGVRKLRSVLDERQGPDHSPSILETAGLRLLIDAGFTGFATEFPIPWAPRKRFDVAFPEHQLEIEWDSRRWHTQVQAFESDRLRDREAVLHGWRVLRFTWDDVHKRPDSVIEAVRVALDI